MITEENEERSMIEPNSRDEPKVRELMKVSITLVSAFLWWAGSWPKTLDGMLAGHRLSQGGFYKEFIYDKTMLLLKKPCGTLLTAMF